MQRTADINNINHVGMAVRDLAATATRYETMGFALTPYSPHSAAWKPGDPVQPLGSGNRCVMFANTYLEILASENPQRPAARIAAILSARRELPQGQNDVAHGRLDRAAPARKR